MIHAPFSRIPRPQPLRMLLMLPPFACRRYNDLGKDGGTAVARALERLTSLQTLDLG